MRYSNPGNSNYHPLGMEGMPMSTNPVGTTTQMVPSIGGNGNCNADFLYPLNFGRSSSAPAAFVSSFRERSRGRNDLTENLSSKKNKNFKHKAISISSLVSFSSAASSPDGNEDALNSRGGDQTISFSQQQYQEQRRQIQRSARADEPNLYDIPSTLHATYRPIPNFLKFLIGIGSLAIVGRSKLYHIVTSPHFRWTIASAYTTITNAFASLPSALQSFSWNNAKNLIFYLFRTSIIAILTTLGIQEVIFRPSRVSTQYLMENDLLPSRLSRYQMVTPLSLRKLKKNGDDSSGEVSMSSSSWEDDENTAPRPIGVHFIQYSVTQSTQQQPDHQLKVQVPEQEPNQIDSPEISAKHQRRQQSNLHAIYLHHGFGASSLSWLPLLPPLVERLRARMAIAHDAVGFGFTDRPNEEKIVRGNEDCGIRDYNGSRAGGSFESTAGDQYSVETNVGIGLALLNDSVDSSEPSANSTCESGEEKSAKPIEENKAANARESARSIAIFGHSMGAKAALIMAKTMSEQNSQLKPTLVVLVAPALEGVSLAALKRRSDSSSSAIDSGSRKSGWSGAMGRAKEWIGWFVSVWKKVFVDLPFQYGLRRLVSGNKNFWKNALKNFVWGDPQKLTDSDVLRFQWPSIGKDWERGLLAFSRSRLSSSSSSPFDDDGTLLRDILRLEGVRVVIMYGSKDRIVGIDGVVAERLKQDYPNVKLVRLEGMGHDPFEEDVDVFLNELEKVLGQACHSSNE